ncbi:NAD-dependent epimerase/dehydratase family protein [Streptomyces chartreusis]|uniref:NAD-dependent epimerase/dehydratase family protein n=1 Tax=Streptomyces chartreusis TaxID=1969 RepID=A0A7H8TK27_STRCX|nr:NAD-dependent epimerase/dehydratase family protein [Streptomyces chartreusis]QKZ23412.1 NAD-dependent epimerase/dehydratase family protein [Streptomyces chartreusis]
MSLHVIVGAGPVGSATARLLADQGEQVRVVTRSGAGPDHPAIERVAADASNAPTLVQCCLGASTIYNCASPPYHQWSAEWPPLAAAFLEAARTSGAVLVTTSNLYGYGRVNDAMTEQHPLRSTGAKGRVRARMWADALAAHEAGRIRTAEVRSSDYLGAGAQSLLTMAVLPKALSGAHASIPADLDAPHSWTYVVDVARTLIAVSAEESAWGHAWHVPTAPPLSVRDITVLACALADAPPPRLSTMPVALLWLGGLGNPTVRELRETQYQFRKPFVLDSSTATKAFGIEPTPLDVSLQETIAHLSK